MDSFWVNPPPEVNPAATARLWDAVLAYMQPEGETRHVCRLTRARIIKASSSEPEITPAIWGLVPPWAAAAERRSVAERHALLDGQLVPNSSMLRDLWNGGPLSQRCLIPAHGWTATSAYEERLAFAPETTPVTFAGLQSMVYPEGRKPEYTFGVFYRVMSLFPYDGSRVPVIIRPEDRLRWLMGKPGEVRRMLVPPGMKVVARRLRQRRGAVDALLGPYVAGLDD